MQAAFENVALQGLSYWDNGLRSDVSAFDARFQLVGWLLFECVLLAAIVVLAQRFVVWKRT